MVHRGLRLNAPCWGAGVCAAVNASADGPVYVESQCPLLGRGGVRPMAVTCGSGGTTACLNAPCWGAGVCAARANVFFGVSMRLNAPCWGAGVCAPRRIPQMQLRACLNAPCWGAGVCAATAAPATAKRSWSQCPLLGRGGVRLRNGLNEAWCLVESQCPLLGRGGVRPLGSENTRFPFTWGPKPVSLA